MPDGYGTHTDYIGRVDEEVRSRRREVETALKRAFAGFLETRSVDVIIFSSVGVMDLADALRSHPIILKPLLTVCNVAGRAIERDLQITAKFAAVIYYPFIDEHINIQSRLKSKKIDGVFFASESDESVETAARILLAQFEMAK